MWFGYYIVSVLVPEVECFEYFGEHGHFCVVVFPYFFVGE